MSLNAREYLTNLYLDWVNNYASLHTLAEHHGLDYEVAQELLKLARKVYNSEHPEN